MLRSPDGAVINSWILWFGVGLRARVQKELFGLLVCRKRSNMKKILALFETLWLNVQQEVFGVQILLQVCGSVCQTELISLKVVEERRQSRCLSERCEQVFTPAARDASPRPTMLTPD